MSTQPCWRIADHADPAWHRWGEGFVVHHALSNDTHQLASVAGRVLEQLVQAGSLPETTLAQNLGLEAAQLDEVLDALRRLDLVTPC